MTLAHCTNGRPKLDVTKKITKNVYVDGLQKIHEYNNAIITKSNKKAQFHLIRRNLGV